MNLMNTFPWIYLYSMYFCIRAQGIKIFEFSNSIKEGSSIEIKNELSSPEKFSICIAYYTRLNSPRRLLSSKESRDIEIQIRQYGYFYIRVAGFWFLTKPKNYDLNRWETLCLSYDSLHQVLNVAFENEIIMKEDKIFPNRTISNWKASIKS